MNKIKTFFMPEGNRNMKKFLYSEYLKRKKLHENMPPGQHHNWAMSLEVKLRSHPTEITESDLHSPLQVLGVAYDITDLNEHRTENYELMETGVPTPVFRRGQPFTLSLYVNRKYNPDNDIIKLVFVYGDSNSSYSTGTRYKISASNDIEDTSIHEWRMLITAVKEFTISITIHTPVSCQVGVWFYRIDTVFKTSKRRRGEEEFGFYILFNPWCPYDEVYLESEHERRKYVLSDHGSILEGNCAEKMKRIEWVYGQFDYVVLLAVLRLLVNSKLHGSQRGNVVLIARELAALINYSDDDGLLCGNWDPIVTRSPDVTPPELWTGSVNIYEQYLANYGRTVKYGQCWVYAGCVTTACRALGIPCRTITCFQCAHDSDKTLTIDYYYNVKGNRIPNPHSKISDHRPWNYHCWNEVWFARNDLQGYDGWQVIDATPQERSEGRYTLGPAPVIAVQGGDVGIKYDVDFVFSEVNADICHLYEDPNSEWGYTIKRVQKSVVGRFVGTYDIDSPHHREELTNSYKYPEGSEEERETFYKALSHTPRAQMFYSMRDLDGTPEDMDFKLNEIECLNFGEVFDISVFVINKSNEIRTVEILLEVNAVDYTGHKLYENIKRTTKDVVFEPLTESTINLQVELNDYQHSQRYSPVYEMLADCKVKETHQVYWSKDCFNICLPNLNITGPEVVKVNNLFSLSLSYDNPLNQTLTSCVLIIESPRLQRPKTLTLGDVPPRGQIMEEVIINPKRVGKTKFIAIFNSEQLGRIVGNILLEVLT